MTSPGKTPPTVGARIRGWLRGRGGDLIMVLVAVVGVALVVAGIALIYPPAGLIAAGFALLAGLFFDRAKLRKLTWPR